MHLPTIHEVKSVYIGVNGRAVKVWDAHSEEFIPVNGVKMYDSNLNCIGYYIPDSAEWIEPEELVEYI